MGKVRTSLVKRTARRLLELFPNEISSDFNVNKELVKKYVHVKSKKLRNQIAGYLTRLVRLKQERPEEIQGALSEATG